jgi:hypothetical protein
VGAVTVTCIFQVLPPALIPGMLAKATVAGPVSTGVPPDTVPPFIATGLESDHPVGAMRRSELIVDIPPTGVWFVKVNVRVCVADGAMEAGNPATLNCFWGAALLGNANAASIIAAIKKQSTLRMLFIAYPPGPLTDGQTNAAASGCHSAAANSSGRSETQLYSRSDYCQGVRVRTCAVDPNVIATPRRRRLDFIGWSVVLATGDGGEARALL